MKKHIDRSPLSIEAVKHRNTKWRLGGVVFAFVSFLLLPFLAKAQLPTRTYGWNLGNTMEPPSGEGTWGPAASQAIINAVADAGFNTIRIPCAWDSHANQSTYQIDPVWMARVKQVVYLQKDFGTYAIGNLIEITCSKLVRH